MRSFKGEDGYTVAVAKERDTTESDSAEVIDLIQLPPASKPRPFADIDFAEVNTFRMLDCQGYNDCLSFAARVQWRGFSCRACPRFVREEPRERSLDAPIASVIRIR